MRGRTREEIERVNLGGRVRMAIWVAACCVALAMPALAENAVKSPADAELAKQLEQIPSGEEGVQQVLDDLTKKLSLRPEQVAQVKPIVEESVSKMGQAKERFQNGEITPMAMGMQIQMATQRAAMQIDPLLDGQQKKLHAALREENKKRLMEEMAKRRAAMGM